MVILRPCCVVLNNNMLVWPMLQYLLLHLLKSSETSTGGRNSLTHIGNKCYSAPVYLSYTITASLQLSSHRSVDNMSTIVHYDALCMGVKAISLFQRIGHGVLLDTPPQVECCQSKIFQVAQLYFSRKSCHAQLLHNASKYHLKQWNERYWHCTAKLLNLAVVLVLCVYWNLISIPLVDAKPAESIFNRFFFFLSEDFNFY